MKVEIDGRPFVLEVKLPSGEKLIHPMPDKKLGMSLWVKIKCTSNAMEFYVDEELVISTGQIHSDGVLSPGDLPYFTRNYVTDSYNLIRDFHYTFSKYQNSI